MLTKIMINWSTSERNDLVKNIVQYVKFSGCEADVQAQVSGRGGECGRGAEEGSVDNEWQSTVVLDPVFGPSRPAGATLTYD